MIRNLERKKIAILATDGFEHSELAKPLQAIKDAGGKVEIVSVKSGEITSWKDGNWGEKFKVDKTLDEVSVDDYDGLVLPGGVINPDKLRR